MPKWLVTVFINRQGTVRSGWKVFGFISLSMSLLAIKQAGRSLLHLPRPSMAINVWIHVALISVASIICVRLEKRSFLGLGLRLGSRWLVECAVGTLGGILLILLTALIVKGFGGFHWERTPAVGVPQLLIMAISFLGVAFAEEMSDRGYPFQRLIEGVGPGWGQLVFAGIFALEHWGNPGMHGATRAWATLNIGLAAILLGFCYLRTRSLALPIGVHLGWNWAQGSLLGFGVSGTTSFKGLWTPVFHGRPEWLTGGSFGLEASLPLALVCGAAILLLWRWKGSAISAGASTASAS